MTHLLELTLPELRIGEFKTDVKRETNGFVEIRTQFIRNSIIVYDTGFITTDIPLTEYIADLDAQITELQAEKALFD